MKKTRNLHKKHLINWRGNFSEIPIRLKTLRYGCEAYRMVDNYFAMPLVCKHLASKMILYSEMKSLTTKKIYIILLTELSQ